jgi:hypothetical protein
MPILNGSVGYGHTHSIPPIGFAVEKLTTTKTHKWNRNLKIVRTHTHKWNRFIIITGSPKTKTHKFSIRKRVLVQKTHRFNKGGKVKKTKTHIFNRKAKISKSKTHKFSIRIKVTRTRTHKYNGIGRIIRTHTHKWSAGGRVLPRPTKTHKYSILKKITKTHTHKFSILTPKIISTELEYYKSSNTANSLGGAIDIASSIVHNTEHNLFDVITASESSSGDTEYRCLYVKNISSRSVLGNSKIWIYTNTPSTQSDVSIGLGTSAISGTEQTIANEGTAPTAVTFSQPTNFSTALSIGNLTAGQYKAVWIKRVITALSSAYNDDNFTLAFAGDTTDSN